MNSTDFGTNDPLLVFGETMEKTCRNLKDFPQYRYFTRPLYKSLVDKVGSVAATGITFFATDMVMHQIVPKIIMCGASHIYPSFITESTLGSFLGIGEGACDVGLYSTASTIWAMTLGAAVMYAKYKHG